jgi:hypothetical protein
MVWMAAASIAGARETMRVVVFDNTGIPKGTLQKAVETAGAAFHVAGVTTDWKVCVVSRDRRHERCSLPPAGSYLEVIIIPDWPNPRVGGDALGLALTLASKQGVVSYAFSNPVKELAKHTDQPVDVVLGCVMAHEIGHLIGLRHAPSGIMKPKFERRDLGEAAMGNLHFGSEEARRLRASTGTGHEGSEIR